MKKYKIKTDKICGKVVKTYALQENSWWSTYSYLTPIILDALRQFRERIHAGVPFRYLPKEALSSSKDTTKKEHRIAQGAFNRDIDRAIEAFQLIQDEDDGNNNPKNYKKDYKCIRRGLRVFAKIYQSLWD